MTVAKFDVTNGNWAVGLRLSCISSYVVGIGVVFNNGPRADCGSPTTLPKWASKVMRPGPKKPALAGPRSIIPDNRCLRLGGFEPAGNPLPNVSITYQNRSMFPDLSQLKFSR